MATMIYKEGMRGLEMIKRIQRVAGCYDDGIYGKLTTEAVKAWQKAHSLKADGIAGPATLAAMGLTQVVSGFKAQGSSVIDHNGVTLKKSKRTITDIVIHCTATPEGQDMTVNQIRAGHLQRGFSDIGYHYIIYRDGSLHLGRDVDKSGAHVENHNSHSIGVVYVGGLENKPGVAYKDLKAKDTRTEAQKAELLSLLIDLRRLYPKAKLSGHRDWSPDKNGNGLVEPSEWIKSCPCFDVKKEFRNV